MEKYCDLHVHSTYSDGTFTPVEIVNAAEGAGLSAVALCDHNTVNGIDDFVRSAEGTNIEAIPGIELSAEYDGIEVHILGLFLPRDSYGKIRTLLEGVIRAKEDSNRLLTESLKNAGYDIDYGEVKERYGDSIINRAHIATILTEKGYTGSVDEAMKGILSVKGGHYVPPKRLSAMYCIDFLVSIGAVPAIAHPFLNLTYDRLREFLAEAVCHGLCGMECAYSTYDEETTKVSFALAQEYGLLASGGSDFHGSRKPDIHLGVGKGNLRIPLQWAHELKKRAKK